ncbi:hypothetical protein J1N35_045170 [Gossypium stocksii]|uniref:Uncharacterized protein n=1 Tax=Gossypium stocksii TaxID=47602 RepID=A0A9D3UAG4_9ROSI|nr:hypothetical protein J1N35_045170 [Gossypium stocksii]
MKGKIEGLESALQNYELRIEHLEAREGHWKEELHHSQDQLRNKDYLMGEAIVQIREVADHLQDLVAQANMLSVKEKKEGEVVHLPSCWGTGNHNKARKLMNKKKMMRP